MLLVNPSHGKLETIFAVNACMSVSDDLAEDLMDADEDDVDDKSACIYVMSWCGLATSHPPISNVCHNRFATVDEYNLLKNHVEQEK